MALIMNATHKTITTKAIGNYFTFKPGQIKVMDEDIARFFATERGYMGFVSLDDRFEDPEFKESPEGKLAIAEARAKGVSARVTYLKQLIYNETTSLKQDLDRANIKADPRSFASDALVDYMEEVASYAKKEEDQVEKKVEKIKELEKKLDLLKI